jgi:hypothetical protein
VLASVATKGTRTISKARLDYTSTYAFNSILQYALFDVA